MKKYKRLFESEERPPQELVNKFWEWVQRVLPEDIMDKTFENDSYLQDADEKTLRVWLEDGDGVVLQGGPFTNQQIIDCMKVVMSEGI